MGPLWEVAEDWHEDDGPVLFAYFDDGGWPYVYFGSPLDTKWEEGTYTHWCRLPNPPTPADDSAPAKPVEPSGDNHAPDQSL